MPEIKICGLTKVREAEYINEASVDYAGFVFYEKSKRNVSIEKAREISQNLDKKVKRVAVCVNPNAELIRQIEEAGFHIIQVHGDFTKDAMAVCELPVWRAVNIGGAEELAGLEAMLENTRKIAGLVIDGAVYGGGKTFSWEETVGDKRLQELAKSLNQKKFILAGGLHAGNVAQGIELFAPDIVDVSSGVEGAHGKEKEKIMEFVREVRKNG